jgi:hypothetical protein
MRQILKIAGILLTGLFILGLLLSAGLIFEMVGDSGPAWTMGLLLLLAPCLIWLYRQFRKIEW